MKRTAVKSAPFAGLGTPVDYWRAGLAFWTMAAEAQTVIALRSLGMMGFWAYPAGEAVRMVAEKQAAFLQTAQAAATGAMRAERPARLAAAVIRPVGRKTRANVARLTKAGPAALQPPRK
ncbi:antifreeze protein [Halodurantibacterium flavum]|uniref:Antifreeze protein n=1 Tax=Halodurantibacterium flavum TaxID=1382802 RepID=A0ABW4S553_9RHOB